VKVEQVEEKKLGSKVDMQKVKNRACRRTKTRFKNRSAKGESRASRRAKTRFRSRFTKGKSRACRKRIKERHIS
jgi:hypothetical protein